MLNERCSLKDAEFIFNAFKALPAGQDKITRTRYVNNTDIIGHTLMIFRFLPEFAAYFPPDFPGIEQYIDKQNIRPAIERGDGDQLQFLASENGMLALLDQLITIEEAINIPEGHLATFLNNDNCLIILREKLITPEQIAALPSKEDVDELLSERGIAELRDKQKNNDTSKPSR